MSEKFDVIIIGGGLSGLLSASYLSRKGLNVCIIEKNKHIGGTVQTFKRNGITFDTGMNFFGAYKEGQIQYELFKFYDVSDAVDITDINEFELFTDKYKYIIYNNFIKFENQLNCYFPEEKEAVRLFLNQIKKIFFSVSLNADFDNSAFFKYYEKSALEFVNSLTSNKELREVLKFNRLLFGNNLETTPLYIYAVITGSFLQSTGTFTFSAQQFTEQLKKEILNNKGNIILEQEVIEIMTENNKVSCCICNDGKTYFADSFLSTIHPQNLIPKIKSPLIKSFYRKRIADLKNSDSSIIINVILKENTVLFDNKPKFINTPEKILLLYFPVSGKNGEYANTLKIMCEDKFSDYSDWSKHKTNNRGEDYDLFKIKKAESIINFAEKYVPTFQKNIKKYYVSTPLTFRDYTGSVDGSSYGILKDFNKSSETIFPVNTKFKNLFLSGQSVNFHGLLGVSITSQIACMKLLKYIKNN